MISSSGSSFEAWVIVFGGFVDKETSGIGIINGLHYCELNDIFTSFIDCISNLDECDELPRDGVVNYLVTNVNHQEGQQSFPETGQWDFLPYWEMNLTETSREIWENISD